MVGVVAVLAIGMGMLQQQTPPPKSLFALMELKPTGKNGYEEYLMAADSIRLSSQAHIIDELTDETKGSYLKRCRAVLAAYPNVYALVAKGNGKPVLDPRSKVDLDTIFPEFSDFRKVAKTLACEAYVRLAEGNSTAAANALIEGLEFADRSVTPVLISSLVGLVNDTFLMQAVDGRTLTFSQKDARRIALKLDDVLSREPHISKAMDGELTYINVVFDRITSLDKPDEDLLPTSSDDPAVRDMIQQFFSLTRSERTSYLLRARVELLADVRRRKAALARPEREWPMAESSAEKTLSMESVIRDMVFPVFSQAFISSARIRTQLRILRLHMHITDYWWEHRRLPETLQKLSAPKAIEDPLTGESFSYEVRGESNYRLSSKGAANMGEIELSYRRPIGQEPPLNIPPQNFMR